MTPPPQRRNTLRNPVRPWRRKLRAIWHGTLRVRRAIIWIAKPVLIVALFWAVGYAFTRQTGTQAQVAEALPVHRNHHLTVSDNVKEITKKIGKTDDEVDMPKHFKRCFGTRERWLNPNGCAWELARQVEAKFGIPAWLTIAQGLQESGGGSDDRSRERYNFFGHKPHGGKHEGVVDKRGIRKGGGKYQSYDSPFWGFHHHGLMVSTKWAKHRKGDSVEDWIDCMCAASNGLGYYDYADCKGKDSKGQYVKNGYEWYLMQHIINHNLVEITR